MAGGDGSLEAFIDGYERRIDLGLVNGRVFVNNVSLGVYAEIVQSDAYRDQKLKTAGDMLPELFGPESEKFDFDLESADGPIDDACMVLVSNNVYELERLAGFGTRVRIDEGVLGSFSGWHHWSVPVLEVQSSGDIKAGVEGEALVLPAPLRFEIVSASH
jgi:diacylglycerol kinase family enzyme